MYNNLVSGPPNQPECNGVGNGVNGVNGGGPPLPPVFGNQMLNDVYQMQFAAAPQVQQDQQQLLIPMEFQQLLLVARVEHFLNTVERKERPPPPKRPASPVLVVHRPVAQYALLAPAPSPAPLRWPLLNPMPPASAPPALAPLTSDPIVIPSAAPSAHTAVPVRFPAMQPIIANHPTLQFVTLPHAQQQQQQPPQPPQNQQQDPESRVEVALGYLKLVKQTLQTHIKTYHKFLEILEEFRTQKIDTAKVIEQVAELFYQYPNLVNEFNKFLPQGYQISKIEPHTGHSFLFSFPNAPQRILLNPEQPTAD